MNQIVWIFIAYFIVVSSESLKINSKNRLSLWNGENLKEVSSKDKKFVDLDQQYVAPLRVKKRDASTIKDLLKKALINSSQKSRDIILGLLQKPTAWLLANAREIVKLIGENVNDDSSIENAATLNVNKRDILNKKDLLKAALKNSSQKTRDVILGLLQKPTAWLLANAREIVKLIGENVDDESAVENVDDESAVENVDDESAVENGKESPEITVADSNAFIQ